ncbi:hypothetical protein GCM10010331_34110 [Streptomyces xanthochromogenes]|uniref:DUF3761 domain-containing protein n=1 Tax=Streptomyces xanthochromogenes TaxID=67384 RepID=UPI0019BD74D8|nr:DUF3761 domain-containing protein [Streptomyces xanthochromogenes]GHB43729.1 hypothetical protein GCM10010331_34110 [Streptomyces xanthochromogenes]
MGCGIMVAALLVVGGCSALINGDDGGSTASSSVSSTAGATASSSASDAKDAKAKTVAVRNFVGMGLQAAQDAAQGDGIRKLDSTDATGQGRSQLWDRNWTVCAQTPAAGSSMSTDATLTFDTVKSSAGETCDGAGRGSSSTPAPAASEAARDAGAAPTPSVEEDNSGSVSGSSGSTGGDSASSTGGSSSSGDDASSSSSASGSQQAPAGATALCNDGSYSYSAHRRGTCSHHGGVATWLAGAPS